MGGHREGGGAPPLTRRELAVLALAAAAAPLASCGDDGWRELAAVGDLREDDFIRREFIFDPERGELGRLGILLRRDGEGVLALREACSHLGCPVRFVAASERFICPCHGVEVRAPA